MALDVYYSVCPFGTGNLLSGGSPTIVVDSNGDATVTLGGATQIDNIGQGVAVEYNSIVSYIDSITDATHFHLVSAIGVDASAQTSTAVTSIHHEFASLVTAESLFTNSDHINNSSLITADVVVHLCCYYDHDDYTKDTDIVDILGATTDATRYLEIVTPNGGTESINPQRSTDGIWDDEKFTYHITNITVGFRLRLFNTTVTGIQFESTVTGASAAIGVYTDVISTAGYYTIDNCLFKANNSSTSSVVRGLYAGDTRDNITLTNSIFFGGFRDNILVTSANSFEMINCVSTGANNDGIALGSSHTITNSLIFDNGADDITGSPTITYSVGDDSAFSGGTNLVISDTPDQSASSYALLVTDADSGDFSIKDTSSKLYDAGTSTDRPATDITGYTWVTNDIGAFAWQTAGGSPLSPNKVNAGLVNSSLTVPRLIA